MTMEGKVSQSVSIQLTPDEALVLFDWIVRFNAREDQTFEDQAEERVLWNIEATLEKLLSEPFSPDYDGLLAAARARVRDPTG